MLPLAFLPAAPLPLLNQTLHHRPLSSSRLPRPPTSCSNGPSPPLSPPSLTTAIPSLNRTTPPPATVHLVGTGPGDPGLLTLSAVSLMSRADVVLYDRLVTPEILSYVNPSARMIYVGKTAGFHTRPQEEIHALLHSFAEKGETVVRLKGGDPFVFGRGGEEVDYLEARGTAVAVTPGITAAAGISAAIGVPLTQRGTANAVKFLTGHLVDGVAEDVGAVEVGTTLVVYMGLGGLRRIAEEVTMKGLRADCPAVAVERGTCDDQRVVWAPLWRLADDVAEAELVSPTLVYIGEVVALAPGWKTMMLEESKVYSEL